MFYEYSAYVRSTPRVLIYHSLPDVRLLPVPQAGTKEVRVLHYYRPQYKGPRSTYRKTPDLKLQLLLLDR